MNYSSHIKDPFSCQSQTQSTIRYPLAIMEPQISFVPKYSFSYDAFLSFRGEDTRHGFTGHLLKAFQNRGINIFFDDKDLRVGDDISPTLLNAIEESRMSIIVFSENYASSTWCLDELVKIVECKEKNNQRVWPIFYKVDPSDVRHQPAEGLYGKAMAKHETRYGKGSERVLKWKSALTEVANLSGYHFTRHEYEYALIDEIVKKASHILPSRGLYIEEHIIGVESCIEEVKQILDMPSNNKVCMLGIYGTGGIGKTTLAKILYNLFVCQFEYATFLFDVSKKSLTCLQERLLSQILELDCLKSFDNVDEGAFEIKKRLSNRRVLLVLDDVDDRKQLQKLVGECNWFACGSIIIVTTRDKQLLCAHGVEKKYKMKNLNDHEAFQLFCLKAFKSSQPLEEFVSLSNEIVNYAGGLPLALRVIGSDLCGKDLDECKCALDQYKRIPTKEIQSILRISYDGLPENGKNIFLDIACFFKGYGLKYVKNTMDACNFGPKYHIGVLIDKSLITIERGHIQMHDLIQDMGREIVREVAPTKLGSRSRLWLTEEVVEVLEENLGTKKIEAIVLDPPKQMIQWNGTTFKKMKNLRILIIQGGQFSVGPKFLPNSLRVLEWNEYSLTSLPPNFHPKKLVIFKMDNSRLQLGKSFMNLKCLGEIDFSRCQFITKFPDMSGTPELRKINLSNCGNLIGIHDSVGNLQKVTHLFLEDCKNLTRLPREMQMTSLVWLRISGCTSLEHFPNVLRNMNSLSTIYANCTLINELPDSIGNLTRLVFLDVSFSNLVSMPESIKKLSNLHHIRMDGCENLQNICEVPSNVNLIEAIGCRSLTSDSCGVLLSQAIKEKVFLRITMPGARIPDWFDHRCKGRVLSFWVRKKFPNFAFAFVYRCGRSAEDERRMLGMRMFVNSIKVRDAGFFLGPDNEGACHVHLFDLCRGIIGGPVCELNEQVFEYPIEEWRFIKIEVELNHGDAFIIDECGIYVYRREISMEDVQFECPYLTLSAELVLRNVLRRGATFHPEIEPPKKLRRKHKSRHYGGKIHNPKANERISFSIPEGSQFSFLNQQNHRDSLMERLWELHLPPKVIIFLWEVCNCILPTSDLLNSIDVQVHQTCSLCGVENETSQHIFLQCTFARALWFGSQLSTQLDSLESPSVIHLIMFCLEIGQFNDEIHKQFTYPIALILFTIWLFRNKVIFKGEAPSSEVALNVWFRYCQRYVAHCPAVEQANSNFTSSSALARIRLEDHICCAFGHYYFQVYLSTHRFKKFTNKITYCQAVIICNPSNQTYEGNFFMSGTTTRFQVLFQGLRNLLEGTFIRQGRSLSIFFPNSNHIAILEDPLAAPPHLQAIVKDVNCRLESFRKEVDRFESFCKEVKFSCGSFPHSSLDRVKSGSLGSIGKWRFFHVRCPIVSEV